MKCTIIQQDINQKITESIFRYKGYPYYFKALGGKKLGLYSLDHDLGDAVHIIDFNDEDFDFSSIPLGYVNYTPYKCTCYLIRSPIRKVRQGINTQNTKAYCLTGSQRLYGSINNVLFHKSFIEMVMDKYPSLSEAIDNLRKLGKAGDIAISKNIALHIDEQDIIKVFYKNQYVGWIQPNKFTVHVKNNELGWVVSKYLSHILGWQID